MFIIGKIISDGETKFKTKQNNNDLLEKMAVQRIAYTRINGLAFKVSSVHIDCY